MHQPFFSARASKNGMAQESNFCSTFTVQHTTSQKRVTKIIEPPFIHLREHYARMLSVGQEFTLIHNDSAQP
jgi:hypothetical protein